MKRKLFYVSRWFCCVNSSNFYCSGFIHIGGTIISVYFVRAASSSLFVCDLWRQFKISSCRKPGAMEKAVYCTRTQFSYSTGDGSDACVRNQASTKKLTHPLHGGLNPSCTDLVGRLRIETYAYNFSVNVFRYLPAQSEYHE